MAVQFNYKGGLEMKRFILSEIIFGALYVTIFLIAFFSNGFEKKSNELAMIILPLYVSMGTSSAFFDMRVLKKAPTVRTIGAFVLGILLFFGFIENNPFGF